MQQTVLVFCSVVKMAGLLQAFADAVLAPFAAPHKVSHTYICEGFLVGRLVNAEDPMRARTEIEDVDYGDME